MITLFVLILGLCIGSFLNVLIDRLPEDESIMGRSHCDHCRHQLAWIDLIPVLSYFILRGKCRYCKKKLSLFYPFVEILTGLIFVSSWSSVAKIQDLLTGKILGAPLAYQNDLLIICLYGIICALIVIFFADLKYHIIPDQATAVMILFSIPLIVSQHMVINHLFAGMGTMMSIYFLYFITRGKGMGFGDVKLAFAMGFLLGFRGGFIALYIGFLLGAIVSIVLILTKNSGLKSKIAFGPFLVIGTVVMLFFQAQVMELVNAFFNI